MSGHTYDIRTWRLPAPPPLPPFWGPRRLHGFLAGGVCEGEVKHNEVGDTFERCYLDILAMGETKLEERGDSVWQCEEENIGSKEF